MLTRSDTARAASAIQSSVRIPQSVAAALDGLDRALLDGAVRGRAAIPTGFSPLDHMISSGLKPGELMLVGGAQGLGKTTLTLQMARNMASAGARVLYVCYEHDERFLLHRLLSLESLDPRDEDDVDGIRLRDLSQQIERIAAGTTPSLAAVAASSPAVGRAWRRLGAYSDRLLLLRGSGVYTDLAALRDYIEVLRADDTGPCVLIVDYLQKVPLLPETPSEDDRITRVAEGLKELALANEIGVVAIVAAEKAGLQAPRLRLHHLRGSSALLYEADIILILNDKYRIVTRNTITFNTHEAQTFRSWVVCTIEKNRAGRDAADLEFRKRFEYACFNPDGRFVGETLIDERIHTEG